MTTEDFLAIKSRLLSGSIKSGNETDLQILMQERLADLDGMAREFSPDKKSRFDFFWETKGIVIEAKIRSGVAATIRQVRRYADYPMVTGVILFRQRPVRMPETMNGKPVMQIDYWRQRL